MSGIGFDEEGIEHIVPDGEEHRHCANYLCGCNPDCLSTESYTSSGHDFWSHWALGSGPPANQPGQDD